jgi:ribonuclease R
VSDKKPLTGEAVALLSASERGLRAHGAFARFDLPYTGKGSPGDLVHVSLRQGQAKCLSTIGSPSAVQAVISALALEAGEVGHSSKLRAEGDRAVREVHDFARRDLRSLPTFTIDGEHTEDFDDALSARSERDGLRVWVHVADVSAYVRPGSPLDTEAQRRCTSVYLPTLTVPMLPEALSTGACSLVPGEDRAAVTCEFLLREGVVEERAFYRSLIRSDARLTYSHVEDVFLGRAEPGPTYAAALTAARQAAVERGEDEPFQEHDVEFEMEGGEVVAISSRKQQESERLIERLMILANQEVARFMLSRGATTLYRTHAARDPERMERAIARLRTLGVSVSGKSFHDVEQSVERHESRHGPQAALHLILRATCPPALYGTVHGAHDGLGVRSYCHFTSPIRRYADLAVHRALLAALGEDEAPRCDLDAVAVRLNERARAVRKLEYRADDACRVSFLSRQLRRKKLPRTMKGTVSGMCQGGCFVSIDGAEGMLSGRELGGVPNEEQTIWRPRGKRSRPLRLGDEARVRIKDLDLVRGRVALALAS